MPAVDQSVEFRYEGWAENGGYVPQLVRLRTDVAQQQVSRYETFSKGADYGNFANGWESAGHGRRGS